MKRIKLLKLLAVATLLCSCDLNNVYEDPQETLMQGNNVSVGFPDADDEFEDYTFTVRGESANFLVTVSKSDTRAITITIEDNTYKAHVNYIYPPSGYEVIFPEKAVNASQAVNVIKNDLDSTDIPDIMEFAFYLTDESAAEDDSLSPIVGKYFMIDSTGALREIDIFDKTITSGTVRQSYLDRVRLNHTQPDRFIYEISVSDTVDEDGVLLPAQERVKIKTMVFDPIMERFIIDYEPIDTDNPLYFGYAWYSAANMCAQYFTVDLLPDFSYDDYIEIAQGDVGGYWFSTGRRFHSIEDLRKYAGGVFTDNLAVKFINDAPQSYFEYKGRVYSKDSVMPYDPNKGILTFTNYEVTESTMIFRSRQETFDEYGNFTGYTDGGNFIISTLGGNYWKVMQYRFPYI
ncbi:MAG: hypothetical protein K6G68_01705 [Oscillospiraceae bacterium]|nr:hypothetical protein [Oscillospiraceae bacterium]